MEKFEKSLEDYRKERGGKLCITDVYSIAIQIVLIVSKSNT